MRQISNPLNHNGEPCEGVERCADQVRMLTDGHLELCLREMDLGGTIQG